MSSNNERVVTEFKTHLSRGEDFNIVKDSDHKWLLQSEKCTIGFLFEQHEDGFIIEFGEVDKTESEAFKPLHILLLRHLRGAYDEEKESNEPAYYAWMTDKYFSDLLVGDFSIRSKYEAVEDEFFDKLFDAEDLPCDHPAIGKIKSFDISWMDEVG